MRFFLAVLLLCCCVGGAALLAAPPARAQEQQQEQQTPEGDEPALPDIAPREVEIRGRLDISLPALRRPALTGLLPRTRLRSLPPAPLPDVETVEPPATAPQALPEGPPTPSGFSELPPPQKGLVEAGAGRYFSRFARGRLALPLAPQWAVRSRLDYTGTDGFAPFDAKDVETPADDLRGEATLRTERSGFTAALTADGFLGQHRLYGTENAVPGAAAHPDRNRYGGGAALRVQAGGGGPGATMEARARYDDMQVQTDVSSPRGGNDRFERSEQRLRGVLRGGASVGGGLRAEADGHASTARLAGGGAFDGTVSFLDGGAGLWLRREGPLRLFAGARVLTFSGETNSGGTYVAPDVHLTWQAAPRIALYARTDPGIEANLLSERYRENPSLLYEEAPQPQVSTLNAEGGVRFFPVPALGLHAFAGYRNAPSILFYEDASYASPPAGASQFYERGVTTARYGDAHIFRVGAALSFRHAERLHASLSLAYRNGQLEGSAEIPYFASVTAQALLSYGFLDGKGRVRLTGSFESARPLTRAGNEDVGAFADLDVEGRYALTASVGLVVGLKNIPAGALERYDRYPRPPLVFESGLRIRL